MSAKYAVIDIEATGGTQKVDRIIEIAILHIDGDQITSRFSSLVNPQIGIPPFITKLTGINNEMVANAPPFHEVARTIVEMTEGRSLVAHNVSFDYRILREEFNRLGYEFKTDTLCTARLSKEYFPEIDKHNLTSVAASLNVGIPARHRAMDDATAAAEIMLKILKKSASNGHALKNMSIYKRRSRLPLNIQEEQILDLPNVCGVYYMLDADDQPVYIGKSLKVRTRIRSHFTENTNKSEKMRALVHSIRYENTGSELMAEIKESLEIRKHKPLLNRAKRKTRYETALLDSEHNGYRTFKIKHKQKLKSGDIPLQWFSSTNATKAYISGLVANFELCGCLCKVNSGSKDCTTHKVGQCAGAYLGHESAEEYNSRFENALQTTDKLFSQKMVILDNGRHEDEYACFLISNHHISHIGYLPIGTDWEDYDQLRADLSKINPIPEIDRIAYRHVYLGKYIRIIEYSTATQSVDSP